jgi:ribosomal protein S27AE
MNDSKLFAVAYWLMHLAPIYVIVAIGLGMAGIPGPVVLAPILIFVVAAAYLASRRCPHCGATIYTADNLKRVQGGLSRIPVYRFSRCPMCGGEL